MQFEKLLVNVFNKFNKSNRIHLVPDIYGKSSKKMVDIRENVDFFRIADKIIKEERSYLYFDRLYFIYQAIKNICRHKGTGLTALEIGVFKGGGSYFIAESLKTLYKGNVKMFCVDTFEGHSEIDLPEGTEGAHDLSKFKNTNFEDVKAYLSVFPFVEVIKNRIQDCQDMFDNESFDFVHLDVDIFEPTIFSLRYFGDRLNPNGIIIVDDYSFTTSPGIRKAVDDFVIGQEDKYTFFETMTGQGMLIKNY